MQDTLSTNGQKTPTSTASVRDGIAATTSAGDSSSKYAGQEKEQTLDALRTYNQALTIICFM